MKSATATNVNPDWAKLPLFDRSKWKRVHFGDVVRVIKDHVDPASGEVDRYVAGEHMESEDVRIRSWGTVGDGYLGPAFIRRFRKGQILYGSRRTYLKKVAVAEWDGVTANTTLVLEAVAGKLLQDLLPWLMLSERFTTHSIQESKGSTNPYINWPDIAKFEFALPPRDQQRRLGEVFWGLDALVEEWHTALQANEAAAKESTRALMFGQQPKSFSGDVTRFVAPCGWSLRPAADLVESPITKGATPSDRLNTVSATIPFLKVYNLTFSGELDFSVDPTYVEPGVHQSVLKRSQVLPGDILMNIVGPPLGKTAIVPEDFPEANINQAIVIYRIGDPELRAYFAEYIRSDTAQAWLERRSKKTSGQRNLTLQLAQELPVPIPPKSVVREMIATSQQFSAFSREVANALASCARLRSSISNQIFGI